MMILNIYLEKGAISLRSDAVKFLKMVAINISTIHHVIDNTGMVIDVIVIFTIVPVDAHSQSVSLIMSLSFSLQFVTSILKHCHTTLKSQVPSDSLTGVVADTLSVIATLLPSVRVWLNWVSTHGSLWQPLISDNPVFVLTFHDFLTEFCHVINMSQVVLPLRVQAPDHVKPLCSKFWEDKELAGFSCLASLASSTHEETLSIVDFNLLTDEQIHFQCLSRLSLLQFETISLTDTSLSTLLSYNDQTNSLNVCLQLLPAQDPPDITKPDSEEEEDELNTQNFSRDATPKADEITESLEILELKKERDRLAEELLKKQQQEEITQTLLNEACNSSVHVEVTIKPHYLVPDTNCFIKYLNNLKDLLSSGHFIIAVPLIVITELEGLSKGDNECQSSVNEFALNSLEFIKSMMSVRSPHLRLITSQGNLMSSLFLTSEEITDKVLDNEHYMACIIFLYDIVQQR
jgi:protein SMG6